jgi:hypothetical protein
LSAVAPAFHPRLHGKLSVMAQLPREVNLAVPASEPHRDPMSRTSTSQDTCSDVRAELHRLVTRSSAAYEASSSWEEFVAHCKNPQGDLHPAVKTLPHRAAHLLDTLRRTGATVKMKTEPWSRQRKVEALKRGFHQSANLHQEFLCEEFVDMIHKSQWVLLPAHLFMDKTNLRLSPLGVVPQRDHRPQTICDYSFFSVNLDTVPLAPQESMQFGRALHRVLQQVSDADPRLGPVHLSKIDIADSFYRIGINANDIPKLGIMFPGNDGEQLVGFPLVLPMGWMQSPPVFTAATETVADLANQKLQDQARCGPHRLDVVRESPPPPIPLPVMVAAGPEPRLLPPRPQPRGRPSPPVKGWDMYVDDFIDMVQGNAHHRQHVKRILFHSLDQVFRPLESTDNPNQQEPASIKKMLKGDASWATRKTILGWTVDTVRMTVELPQHRIDQLFKLLNSIAPAQRRRSVNKWEKQLGELRSMVLAIPGGRGLFSVLQEVLKIRCDKGTRVRLIPIVHSVLQDFRWLATDMLAGRLGLLN